ncbi:hypothetical protein CY34DRAFT_584388 [Suillus luteus UH-Slu-Lm8-n1]|uniref:Uncharacterized protein n=1 Tax=Suillus luteus UH-Slu-Lm8-n1 TaxID=930992 RepID=A0A0D0AT47_9AGAM|nr:hypothetical protein CY34DRAFT_584388 [Suillus luteus UH-Slu-Lm8-n1]
MMTDMDYQEEFVTESCRTAFAMNKGWKRNNPRIVEHSHSPTFMFHSRSLLKTFCRTIALTLVNIYRLGCQFMTTLWYTVFAVSKGQRRNGVYAVEHSHLATSIFPTKRLSETFCGVVTLVSANKSRSAWRFMSES